MVRTGCNKNPWLGRGQAGDEVGRVDAQGGGQLQDVGERDVALASLNAADVRPVQARGSTKLVLGQANA